MIWTLIQPFLGELVIGLTAFAALFGYGRSQRRKGRSEAITEALKEDQKKQERGREAVQDLRGADRDHLADRLRQNDGQWQ